jgi:homoserine dehydrogenase
VVADITDVAINLAGGTVRRIPAFREGKLYDKVLTADEITSRYYLRFDVKDCPGVVASITRLLADRDISISSMIQDEAKGKNGNVPLVILTHAAPAKALKSALAEIATLSINQSPVKVMRIEDL